jgi:hypothetical protein
MLRVLAAPSANAIGFGAMASMKAAIRPAAMNFDVFILV